MAKKEIGKEIRFRAVTLEEAQKAAGHKTPRNILLAGETGKEVRKKRRKLNLIWPDGYGKGKPVYVIKDSLYKEFLTGCKNNQPKHRVPKELIFKPYDRNLWDAYRKKYARFGAGLITIHGVERFFRTENPTSVVNIVGHLEEVPSWEGHRLFTVESAERFVPEWLERGNKVARGH